MALNHSSAAICAFGATAGWDVAIVVPARDEVERITACLSALATSAANSTPVTVGVVLVVNNSTDATALSASDWASNQRGPMALVIVEHHFPPNGAGVGAARRLGFDLALERIHENGVLLMTDADTHVSPSWIMDHMAELRKADVICGLVDAISSEQAALPIEISQHGSWESDYVTAALKLSALLDPLPYNPAPTHHNAAGANMGFRKSVYRTVGGMPALKVGEDRTFVALAEAQDYRIRYSNRPVVRTSCRLIGRTEGGMAGALRERRDLTDPPSDEWLEPALTFYTRYAMRGALRAIWPQSHAVFDVLLQYLGPQALVYRNAPLPDRFGAFIQAIEARENQFKRVRMRQSDCRRELPLLLNLLAARLADPAFDLRNAGPLCAATIAA